MAEDAMIQGPGYELRFLFLSTMSLRRSENDRTPNDTTGPTHWHTLPGSDSVKLPGVAETSKAATLNTNYSKCSSGKFKFTTSYLCGFR